MFQAYRFHTTLHFIAEVVTPHRIPLTTAGLALNRKAPSCSSSSQTLASQTRPLTRRYHPVLPHCRQCLQMGALPPLLARHRGLRAKKWFLLWQFVVHEQLGQCASAVTDPINDNPTSCPLPQCLTTGNISQLVSSYVHCATPSLFSCVGCLWCFVSSCTVSHDVTHIYATV